MAPTIRDAVQRSRLVVATRADEARDSVLHVRRALCAAAADAPL